jgi:hypothetical protein
MSNLTKFPFAVTGDEFHKTNSIYQEAICISYVGTRFAVICHW